MFMILLSCVFVSMNAAAQNNKAGASAGNAPLTNKSRCAERIKNDDCAFKFFYISGSVGTAIGGSDLDVQGAANELGFDVFDIDEDDSRLAFKASIGASLTTKLALELGYTRLADAEVAFSTVTNDPARFFDVARAVRPGAVDGFSLALVYSFYTAEDYFVYGRAGVFQWEGEYDSFNVTANQSLPSLPATDGTDLLLGLGVTYKFADRTEANLEWERYSYGDFDDNLIWLGLTYHFKNEDK
ncbi:outer membrane beta-barrel protein [Glaciecola siphonariae]|uniref:Outer membrane beta-barrel protein n=1 Tax=Glaciecola siphonariae TaxID=521012 RepID=A0ABV9LYC2_9ALTE